MAAIQGRAWPWLPFPKYGTLSIHELNTTLEKLVNKYSVYHSCLFKNILKNILTAVAFCNLTIGDAGKFYDENSFVGSPNTGQYCIGF